MILSCNHWDYIKEYMEERDPCEILKGFDGCRLLAAVALAGNGNGGEHKRSLISIWVVVSGVAFVAFMLIVIRPAMKWIARRCSEHDMVDEAYICLTLAGVMVSGLMTDPIAIHSIFGAFGFGLTIPEGEFAEALMERIEDFVSGLLLPLCF